MRNLLEKQPSAASKYISTIKQAPIRTLAGIAIMLLSSLIGGLVLRQQSAEITVLQIQREVAAGEEITAEDVRLVRIPANMSDVEWLTSTTWAAPQFANHWLPAKSLLTSLDVTSLTEPSSSVAVPISAVYVPEGVRVGSYVTLWQTGNAQPLVLRATVTAMNPDIEPGKIRLTLRVRPDVVPMITSSETDLKISTE